MPTNRDNEKIGTMIDPFVDFFCSDLFLSHISIAFRFKICVITNQDVRWKLELWDAQMVI